MKKLKYEMMREHSKYAAKSGRFQPVAPETEAYIIAHMNDRPRSAAVERAGVSLSTFYRIVREHGGELRYDCSQRNERAIEAVKTLWHDHTAKEVEALTGFSRNLLNKWAQRLGIRHSQQTVERMEREHREHARQLHKRLTKEDYARSAEKCKRHRKADYVRILQGDAPLYGYRYAYWPQKVSKVVHYLRSRYDYIIPEKGSYVLLYDEQTTRTSYESYYVKKYKLEFKPAEGEGNIEELKY